jgi:hypothetical protein
LAGVPQDKFCLFLQVKEDKVQAYTMTKAVKVYTRNGGILVTLCSLFFFLAAQTDRQIADWWIRIWVSGGYGGYTRWGPHTSS